MLTFTSFKAFVIEWMKKPSCLYDQRNLQAPQPPGFFNLANS